MAPRKTAPRKAASKTTVKPSALAGTTKRPEADAEPSPIFRADMGEGLPPQKDSLNPNRAK